MILLIVLFVGWWSILRIVEHDHWPPPANAVTATDAQAATEALLAQSDLRHTNVNLDLAPSTASDVRLFLDGTTFFPAMMMDLESAEDSIHINVFGFTPGTWGDRFADLLIARDQSGVDVRIVVDRQGSKAASDNEFFYDRLAAGGVQIVVHDTVFLQASGEIPDRDYTWRQDEIGRANHRKMIVIDGRIGWVGGAGLEDHFADGGWIDTFARVEGAVVSQLQAIFCTSFAAYGGSLPADISPFFPRIDQPGDIPVTVLQNAPGGFLPGTQATRELIETAENRLDVMNAYFTDAGMIDRIVAASERGVDVRIVVSRDSNNMPAQLALQSQYERLIAAGVEVWEVPGVMHSKVTVADATVIIGSINYDAWALYRNFELALMIEDATIADEARSLLVEPMVGLGEPGQPPDGWRESVPADLWWLLRYVL